MLRPPRGESVRHPRGSRGVGGSLPSDDGFFLEKKVGARDRRPDARRVDFVQILSRESIRQRSLPHGQSNGDLSPYGGWGPPIR